jgi:alkaline phosphatase D
MSSLREPHLGPIVGHTTDRSCRLWIRARDLSDKNGDLADDRRTIGVLGVMSVGDKALPPEERPVFYFRLRREYDRTGTFNLGADRSLGSSAEPVPLAADTEYRVRVGTMSVDDPLPNERDLPPAELVRRLPPVEAWRSELDRLDPEKSEAVFRTFPPAGALAPSLAFLLGSCRYPGILFQEREADQIFGPMREEAMGREGRPRTPFTLLAGDQIYADLLNRLIPIGRADTFEEFQERYHTAFGSLAMRHLLRSLPTYMILDDHEIEDNWTQDRVQNDAGRNVFMQAIRAYLSYQWSHGPRTWDGRLYYTFECGGYPFFILDTRTQRFIDDDPKNLDDNHMLGRPALDPTEPSQLDELLKWLEAAQKSRGDRPKFIVTSSVFVPNDVSTTKKDPKYKLKDDSWPAFPVTRRAILDRIVKKQVQNVVFLAGDIHCSNVAELSFSGSAAAQKLKTFSVTSSAFYWPFPFADGNPADYVHDSTDKRTPDTFTVGGGVTMDYTAGYFTQDDNFCRIDVDQAKAEMTVRFFNWKGEPITKDDGKGGRQDLVARLRLAGW